MRKDVYVVNDAGSWSVVAADAVNDIVNDAREQDARFVQSFKALLFAIEGDDYNVIRIVANEPLTEAEETEWIARVCWRINTTDGKILVSGGFDPDCLAEWQEQGETEYVRAIDVPAGDYQVVFYTYLHSMNGAVWLHSSFIPSPFPNLLSWFQQDYPGRSLPAWLAAFLQDNDLDDDSEMQPISEAIQLGQLSVADQPKHWIGYLVHIIPFEASITLDTPEGSWFEPRTGLRVPAKCPLGISTDCTGEILF